MKYLVLDAAPIIKSLYSLPPAEHYITTPEVLAELKDSKTLENLKSFPHTIKTKSPSPEAIQFVVEFSKKTGDFQVLSKTDLKVIALTLQLEWELHGREHLNRQPPSCGTKGAQDAVKKDDKLGEKVEEETLEAVNATTEDTPETKENPTTDNTTDAPKKKKNRHRRRVKKDIPEQSIVEPTELFEPEQDEKDQLQELDYMLETTALSSDGEWITPETIEPKEQILVDVACITDDFAMQNVLLQIKLHLITISGLQIKKLKSYVLRCHACFQVTLDLEKQFCGKCGNATLIRTSVQVDENGMKLFLKKNWKANNRGTRFSIPTPQTGKKAHNLILREDQKEYQRALKAKERIERKMEHQDGDWMFGDRFLTASGVRIGNGKRNVNEVRGRRRK